MEKRKQQEIGGNLLIQPLKEKRGGNIGNGAKKVCGNRPPLDANPIGGKKVQRKRKSKKEWKKRSIEENCGAEPINEW